jgi:hypothetical protein
LLARVGRALREHVRASDLAARVGGDEFAVLLPQADRAAAERTAAKLASRIRAATRPVGGPRVGASIGIAVLGTEAPDAATAMARADDALYRAKHATAIAGAATPFRGPPRADATPSWAPDGRRIVFERLTDAGTDLWVISADGTGAGGSPAPRATSGRRPGGRASLRSPAVGTSPGAGRQR